MLISYFLSHVNLPKNTLYLLTNKVFPIFLLYKLRKKLIPKKKKKNLAKKLRDAYKSMANLLKNTRRVDPIKLRKKKKKQYTPGSFLLTLSFQ